ncbi:type 1 glutamine amidotransferase [Actibacterium ureilyticum]|uniref:type 1 glutamine amidotransferase n=1 Tax=Actibacterium ureilyticum TaxID=1590614 RepID=UPI000BAAFFDF|nr:type 1 glutamine amidotransferase [Actibacterium ureilyticum]
MRIGILQTGHAPEPLLPENGTYPDMFKTLLDGHGFDFQNWDIEGMEFPASVHDADGWLITGSRHGAYEDHAFIPPLETFIRDAYAAHVPMVGICFGHQIMAQALGGRVEKFTGGWAVGKQTYRINGADMRVHAWHQDQVVDLPPDAQVLGGNDFCQYAALAYDDRALSFQPHPEFRTKMTQGLARTRGMNVVPQPLLDRVLADHSPAEDAPRVGAMIADFFLQPRGGHDE